MSDDDTREAADAAGVDAVESDSGADDESAAPPAAVDDSDRRSSDSGDSGDSGDSASAGDSDDSGAESSASEATPADEPAAPADEPAAPSKPAVVIPPPKLTPGRTAPARRGLDGATLAAMLLFVVIGGVLVFGFAQTLVPAAEAQLGAPCRPLSPEPRNGAAPELELEDLEGNPVSLADFRGKFLIVNFWATWCEPCTREWPDLDQLGQRLAERDDVVIVAIGVDKDKQDLGPYLERMGLGQTPVKVLWARDAEAYKRFGSEKLPDTYFVDRDGQMQAVFVNVRAWGKAAAVRCVESSAG